MLLLSASVGSGAVCVSFVFPTVVLLVKNGIALDTSSHPRLVVVVLLFAEGIT